MKQRDKQATRQRILDTALEKFSEKGFDGTGISQIAKEAGINSALLYYYFDNKQAILDELLNSFIQKANSFLMEMAIRQMEFGSAEMKEQMDKYDRYLLENDKTLRLLLTESLKDHYDVPPLFKLIDFNASTGINHEKIDEQAIIEEMNQRGFNMDSDSRQRQVTEFFTGIMPTVIFSLFRHQWCRHFKIEPDQLMALFTKANEITHGYHHQTEKD